MTGQDLFNKYTDLNENSTEQQREYSQTLFTAVMLDSEAIFDLLETAEKQSKKLSFIEPSNIPVGADYEPSLSDIVLI